MNDDLDRIPSFGICPKFLSPHSASAALLGKRIDILALSMNSAEPIAVKGDRWSSFYGDHFMQPKLNAATSSTMPSAFTRIDSRNNLQSTTPTAYAPNLRTTTNPRQEALTELRWIDDNAVLSEESISDEENMAASEPEIRVLPSSQARFAEAKPSWWNEDLQSSLDVGAFHMPFHLDISHQEIFAWIATSPVGLNTLNLEGDELSYQDLRDLADALKKNADISRLILDECRIDDKSVIVIADILRENKHLQSIALRYDVIPGKGITAIFKALTTNTSLINLDVSCNSFDTDTAEALVELLSIKKNLKQLKIASCGIPFEGLEKIILGLMSYTGLDYLDISLNTFDAKCEAALVNMIKTNKNIEVLEMYNCEFSNIGMNALLDAVKFNTKIKDIFMREPEKDDSLDVLIEKIPAELEKNRKIEKTKKGANFTLEIINSVLGRDQNPGAKPEEYNLMYPREIMGLITDQMMQAALKDTLITMSAMSGDENY